MSPAEDPSVFTILTVCTGNICRSPLAEQLLARQLVGVSATVSSAGTHALVGHPMDERSQQIARRLGIQGAEDHRSRQLTREILESADLILTMAREHRRLVVELSPRVAKRTFTIREFARLGQATTDNDIAFEVRGQDMTGDRALHAVADIVSMSRGLVPPVADPTADDVVDPFRKDQSVYELSTEQVVPAVGSTAQLLRRVIDIANGAAD